MCVYHTVIVIIKIIIIIVIIIIIIIIIITLDIYKQVGKSVEFKKYLHGGGGVNVM